MVRITSLTLVFLVLITGCSSIRGIEVCVIKSKGALCSDGKRQYRKSFKELKGYYATAESELRKIANKLQHCEEQAEANK